MTGAVAAAPSVGEPAHHPLDRMGFYGFGQTLKPAVCEKCHNPKNSKNTCTDATTADDCGVMSLGHSPVGGGSCGIQKVVSSSVGIVFFSRLLVYCSFASGWHLAH